MHGRPEPAPKHAGDAAPAEVRREEEGDQDKIQRYETQSRQGVDGQFKTLVKIQDDVMYAVDDVEYEPEYFADFLLSSLFVQQIHISCTTRLFRFRSVGRHFVV